MDTTQLTNEDEALINQATETCERSLDPGFFEGAHIVAAAVQTTNGDTYNGVSLPANTGRACTCAETVAVGSAIADSKRHDDIETCVAVEHPMPYKDIDEVSVIPPCGTCREMLADYGENIRVIVPVDGENNVVSAIELLPTRTW
jgi:cytidine deaminase